MRHTSSGRRKVMIEGSLGRALIPEASRATDALIPKVSRATDASAAVGAQQK